MSEKRIMIVEDDLMIQKLLIRYFDRATDCLLATFEDGQEAWDTLQEMKQCNQLPDVIITDNDLPGKKGLELIELITSHNINVPVVLMTGGRGSSELEHYAEQYGIRTLKKPFVISDIENVVKDLI